MTKVSFQDSEGPLILAAQLLIPGQLGANNRVGLQGELKSTLSVSPLLSPTLLLRKGKFLRLSERRDPIGYWASGLFLRAWACPFPVAEVEMGLGSASFWILSLPDSGRYLPSCFLIVDRPTTYTSRYQVYL